MNKTNKEVVDWLLLNRLDKDGNLDLSDLDFGEFKGKIKIDRIKSEGDISHSEHTNKGNIEQRKHSNGGNICQEEHTNLGAVRQDRHCNGDVIEQTHHDNEGDVYSDYPIINGCFVDYVDLAETRVYYSSVEADGDYYIYYSSCPDQESLISDGTNAWLTTNEEKTLRQLRKGLIGVEHSEKK